MPVFSSGRISRPHRIFKNPNYNLSQLEQSLQVQQPRAQDDWKTSAASNMIVCKNLLQHLTEKETLHQEHDAKTKLKPLACLVDQKKEILQTENSSDLKLPKCYILRWCNTTRRACHRRTIIESVSAVAMFYILNSFLKTENNVFQTSTFHPQS